MKCILIFHTFSMKIGCDSRLLLSIEIRNVDAKANKLETSSIRHTFFNWKIYSKTLIQWLVQLDSNKTILNNSTNSQKYSIVIEINIWYVTCACNIKSNIHQCDCYHSIRFMFFRTKNIEKWKQSFCKIRFTFFPSHWIVFFHKR